MLFSFHKRFFKQRTMCPNQILYTEDYVFCIMPFVHTKICARTRGHTHTLTRTHAHTQDHMISRCLKHFISYLSGICLFFFQNETNCHCMDSSLAVNRCVQPSTFYSHQKIWEIGNIKVNDKFEIVNNWISTTVILQYQKSFVQFPS